MSALIVLRLFMTEYELDFGWVISVPKGWSSERDNGDSIPMTVTRLCTLLCSMPKKTGSLLMTW